MTVRSLPWPSRGHNYLPEEIECIHRLLSTSSSVLTQGDELKSFEKEFQEYVGSEYAFGLASCANALDIAASLIGLKPGDEVIIPSHTYCASAIAFARRGATIKWCDIDRYSWTCDINSISKLVTAKTKAIVVVHLYGLICPHIQEICNLARERGIYVVEDCAQSLGAKKSGLGCGSFGDLGCFSFHAQKNLSTLGEGGMLTTKHAEFAALIPGLRLNGHRPFPNRERDWLPAMVNVDEDLEDAWPIKSSMTEVQAAVGRSLLKRLDSMISKRRQRALSLRDKIKQNFNEIQFQAQQDQEVHANHLIPFWVKDKNVSRDEIVHLLRESYGIKAIIQYHPLHKYDLFRKKGHGLADVPESEDLYANMVSLPFSLIHSDLEFNYLVESLNQVLLDLGVR